MLTVDLALATQRLDMVKAKLAAFGLQHGDVPDLGRGVGVAVGFAEDSFTVLTVGGGGAEGAVNVNAGVLADVGGDRLAVLEAVNALTRQNTFYPAYLSDADGWAVNLGQKQHLSALLANDDLFRGMVVNLPAIAAQHRSPLTDAGLTGRAFRWTDADIRTVALNSLS